MVARAAREQAARERERERIDHVAGLVHVAHRGHRQQRAEDLLAQDRRVGREIGHEPRRAEPALGAAPRPRPPRAPRPSRRSARTRSCASRSITGGTSVANSSAWPTSSTRIAPASRSSERVRRRLVHEHPRGRGALLAGVAERRVHDLRHHLVEVGVGVHDHAVLAAHLGHDPLHVALALGRLRGGAQDLEPDGARAGEGDHVHARVAHQRGPRLAVAGQQRQRVARHAGRVERVDERSGARGRLLGRLQHRGVPGRQRRGGHAARESRAGSSRARSRRPRRAARSASCCARPAPGRARGPRPARAPRARSTRGSRSPRTRRRPPPATASRTRAPAGRPARAAARAGSGRRRGSTCGPLGGGAGAPLAEAALCGLDRGGGVLLRRARCMGHHALRARPGRWSRRPLGAAVAADQTGTCSGSSRVERRAAPPAAIRAPVRAGARGPARSGSSRRCQQLLERGAALLLAEEGLVRGVLQQPPHEVRHAGDQSPTGQ